jgi:competence protein ComEC
VANDIRRPSIFLLAALWTGILSAGLLGLNLLAVIAALSLTAIGLGTVRGPRLNLLCFSLAFLLLGVLRSPDSHWNRTSVPPDVMAEGRFPVELTVEAPLTANELSGRIKARVTEVAVGYPSLEGSQVLLRTDRDVPRLGRDETVLRGVFRVPRQGLNPYEIDRLSSNLRRGIIGIIDVKDARARGRRLTDRLSSYRQRLEGMIKRVGSDETAGMLEALLLGKRSDLSSRLEGLMIRAGTYHVLAISGLHVGIVVVLIISFLSMLRLGRRARVVVALVCVLGYVLFTGARPSTQRAGTLFLLLGLSRLLQWKIDHPNCVCAVGIALLIAFPHLAWDVGFRLSLGAVFGITLFVPQIMPRFPVAVSAVGRLGKYILVGLAASFSAQIFTLPVILYSFGRTSLLGPISNLVVIPLITLTVAAGIEASVAMLFSERLALLFLKAADTLADLCITSVELLTRFVNPLVWTGRPCLLRILIYSAGLAVISLGGLRMSKRLIFTLLLLLYALLVVPFPKGCSDVLEITFLYVGDGDAALIEMPGGKTMLVDAGPSSMGFDAARAYILPFLALKGIGNLDQVIVTHPHSDHYGGLSSLIETLGVREVVVGTTHGEARYEDLLERARLEGIEVRQVRRGDTLSNGDVVIEVLHPSDRYLTRNTGDPNEQSVVFMLRYKKAGILFTGDVTPSVQMHLVESSGDLGCDILKVPHHGAPYALDTAFVHALGAAYGIISVGSKFASHPSPSTIDLLERLGMQVFSTVSDGAITVTTDGTAFVVRPTVRKKTGGAITRIPCRILSGENPLLHI